MGFSNPIVGGVVLRRPAIQSPDFLTGVRGWTVNADGSAEFNDVVVRGSVHAGDNQNYIEIDPTPIPVIILSTAHADQQTPGSIGYGILGGNVLFFNGPDFGSGQDSITFEAAAVAQQMTVEFQNRLEINRANQATRIIMTGSGITLVGNTSVSGNLSANNIQVGTSSFVFNAATSVDVNVTFATPFTTTPRVTATLRGLPANSSALQIRTNNVTTTGMTIRVADINAVARTLTINVDWHAIA